MSSNHKKSAPLDISIAVISVSSTRKIADDKSGIYIKTSAEKRNYKVTHHLVVDDDIYDIQNAVNKIIEEKKTDSILITGGTGITQRDVTVEAVKPLFRKELTAYGTVFSMLSFDEIGSAAILSRAVAGIVENTAIFCMPGSEKACRLACEKIIFGELPHIKKHIMD